jgi:hypothetical protein
MAYKKQCKISTQSTPKELTSSTKQDQAKQNHKKDG